MKILSLSASALTLTAALLLAPSTSKATLVYNDGDLLLGFTATSGTGSSVDYLVDLGSATNYIAGGSFATGAPVKLTLGNIGADLAATYGAGWATNANLIWSINGTQRLAGNGFAKNTAFGSLPESTVGVQTIAPPQPSVSSASNLTGKLLSQSGSYALGSTNTNGGGLANGDQVQSTNSTVALFQPVGFSQSYASYQPNGVNTSGATAYGYYNPGNLNDFTNGVGGSVADLYELGSGATGVNYLGVFQFDNSGNLYFDSASPSSASFPLSQTPEPTSFAMLAIGAGFLGMARRRRAVQA